MFLDLIFGLVLLAMFGLGAWRGAVVSGSGLLTLVCGYAGGIAAASTAAGWVARTLVVSPLVAPAIAGTIGFVVAWLLVSSVADVAVAWDRGRVELGGRSLFDRGMGGFFGLARGGLIVVLLAVLASWIDAARDLGAVDGLAAMPDAETSRIAEAAGGIVETALSGALADAGPAGEVVARLTARPGQALGSVQAILEDERMNGLFEDRLFWTLISNGSVDYAMNRNAIRSIVNDPEMRGRFADLGLVQEPAREDVDLFRDTMADVLAEVGPKIERLQNDPEVKDLGNDPEIMALVEAGNTFALMNHPRIRRIVSRISSEL
jgi:membrane protein required for colicin V production